MAWATADNVVSAPIHSNCIFVAVPVPESDIVTLPVLAAHRLPLDQSGLTSHQPKGLYFLPAAASSITIHDQQVRATNLACAIARCHGESSSTLPSAGIIGGGFSGQAIACYLADNGFSVKVFSGPQANRSFTAVSARWIFPRLFDWPSGGWDNTKSRLPLIPWKEGPLPDCIGEITAPFKKLKGDGKVEEVAMTAFVDPRSHSHEIKVGLEESSAKEMFDVVVYAPGPGSSPRTYGQRNPLLYNYWTYGWDMAPTALSVVGFGDGAAQDLLYNSFKDFSYSVVRDLLVAKGQKIAEEARQIEILHPNNRAAAYAASNTYVPELLEYLAEFKTSQVFAKDRTLFHAPLSALNMMLIRHAYKLKAIDFNGSEVVRNVTKTVHGYKVQTESSSYAVDQNFVIRAGVEPVDLGQGLKPAESLKAAEGLQEVERRFPRHNQLLRVPLWGLSN